MTVKLTLNIQAIQEQQAGEKKVYSEIRTKLLKDWIKQQEKR